VDTYDVLEALGDPTRRAVFELLGDGPRSVGDLAAQLPVTRPAVSQHLKVLKRAGAVRDERLGTRRVYSVDPAAVVGLRDYFDRFWERALHGFKAAAEKYERKGEQA
jgi:DNA-binding transcriptional ArsR family regulator